MSVSHCSCVTGYCLTISEQVPVIIPSLNQFISAVSSCDGIVFPMYAAHIVNDKKLMIQARSAISIVFICH